MNVQSLKTTAAHGMAWNAFNTFIVQGINVLIGIILARILLPSDYGLIGMLAIFIAISQLFIEGGFLTALIQKNNCSDLDYSTVFYFNLVSAVILYLILFSLAPLIAGFYHRQELIELTRVLSLNLIFNSLSIVQQARLYIKLNFKRLALVSLLAVIISAFIGLFLAYYGFGVWALVIQGLAYSLSKTACLFYFDKWSPQFVFSRPSFKQLFGYSFKLMSAKLIATIMANIYALLIGRKFTAEDLGFYTTAQKYPDLLAYMVINILQNSTFSVLASVQRERERMVSIYERLMGMTVFFVMPMMTLFALLASPFIRVVLTDKWMPAVPLLQWLCFCRIITTISIFNINILNVVGRSDLYLKLEILKSFVITGGLFLTIPLGLKAVVIGYAVVVCICFVINAHYPGELFGYGAFRQIKEMRHIIYATLIMSVTALCTLRILSSDLMKLFICIPLGIVVYLAAAYLFRIKEINEVHSLLRSTVLKMKASLI